MDKSLITFNPTDTKLLTGINLIEASAGTGKTYAIAMLVLRFVVEQQLDIKQILVVTFTKAATEELKDRIRNRLVETRLAVGSKQSCDDVNILNWLNNLKIEPQLIIKRLNNALMDIDQAGIFTIHGFCQRILSEQALQSGQLFNAELTGDISTIQQSCCDDFWRRQVYLRSAWEASILTIHYQTPDRLLASVQSIPANITIFPDYAELEENISDLKLQVNNSKPLITNSIQCLQEKLAEGKFKQSFADHFHMHSQNMIDWLDYKRSATPDFSLFTDQGLLNALNGHKFRTSKTNTLSSEEQKLNYLTTLEFNSEPFKQLELAINNLSLIFRRSLLQSLHLNVEKNLQQQNILSFDTLITRLSEALQDLNRHALAEEIQQRYLAALIDEFQDTDQNQWLIFSTLFRSANHYLYLIGDPKQAIYKFRGADINSYFTAQKQAQHVFTLDKNWRSHPQLVAGINTLFSKPNAFYSESLSFNPVNAALTASDGELIKNKQEIPPIVLWQLENEEDKYWSSTKAVEKIKTAIVNEIIDLLSSDFKLKSYKTVPLQANDIAILVRSNSQAKEFQQILNQVGLNAVINSKESVFLSTEAVDLYTFLRAIVQPGNNALLKQALTLDWFNMSGQQLFQTLNNEKSMDRWVSDFQQYLLDWQNKGLMTMMREVIKKENIYPHLSRKLQAERRITNLQHIIELVQQAAIDEHLGINKTLDWLRNSMSNAKLNKTTDEEQQLRLESDDEAINIITMHSAKGLEYPVVFCPFPWQRGTRIKQEKELIKCYTNAEMIVDLGSEKFEQHRSIALDEELAEDIRVFYVAVTRAKYRCYINWADVRSKDRPNNSAIAYLLNFSADDFAKQQAILQNYSRNQPSVFEYRLLKATEETLGSYRPQVSTSQLSCKQKLRSLFNPSQMTSYTALSSLSLQDTPELPSDKAREEYVSKLRQQDSIGLPKGAHTGNVIHDLLEKIPFKTLAENNDISVQRDKSCLRYGLKTNAPELINQLLKHTVTTQISADSIQFSLHQLNEQLCLKEMPFYLKMDTMNIAQINKILKNCPTYQSLSEKKMSGYLTGFIDLICQYNGKYYLIDYKSNSLESYDQPGLIQSMREHNYGLQYWIYTLVLHQYLKNRLPHYNYAQHIGGVKYLFVRGMNANLENSGVYQTIPDENQLEQLSKLFISNS